MKIYTSWLFVLCALASIIFIYKYGNKKSNFTSSPDAPIIDIKKVKAGDFEIKVETVSTPEALERGLSGHKILQEDEGMLFVFKKPSIQLFWMKDMTFAIDMIWIDEGGKIIYIEKNATPESFPKTFGPRANAKYVLEVLAGFSDRHNLVVGSNVEFLP